MTGIYIHFPFCEKKCCYCDFYSQTDLSKTEVFINSLQKEIGARLPLFYSKPADTIYFGGGTPSLASATQLELILDSLYKNYKFADDTEITIECNPGTISEEKLRAYRKIGINRISIGVQSFDDKELLFLERIHNSEQAVKSVEYAQNAGFDNIGIDLIWGIPGQSPQSWESTLETTLQLPLSHVSAYNLIYEKDTPLNLMLKQGKFQITGEDDEVTLYEMLCSAMQKGSFEHYEISNFAKAGMKSRHNSKYWNGDNYFGLGPSAHSFSDGKRSWNFSDLKKYIDFLNQNVLPLEAEETLTEAQKFEELVFLGLRSDGLNLKEIDEKYMLSLQIQMQSFIQRLIDSGMLISENNRLKLTDKGYLLCQEITIDLLREAEKFIPQYLVL